MATTRKQLRLPQGSTSVLVNFRAEDSAATTGAGKTGLAFNTASLIAYYSVDGAAPVAIALVTAVAGIWTSSGFVELDSTHMPGMYQLGIPNAALSAGRTVDITLSGAAGMSPVHISIELQARTIPESSRTYTRQKASTKNLVTVRIDSAVEPTANGLTGLVFNSAGLTAYYSIDGATPVAITLVTMVAGTWVSGGFVELDATHLAGVYQIGLPDACFAAGSDVDVFLYGAAGMAPCRVGLHLSAGTDQVGHLPY